jgi:hypothetical protein
LLAHQREKEKKKSGDRSVNVYVRLWAHLPTAVSLLLLEVLLITDSGVSLTLT